MRSENIGSLPIAQNDRLIGMMADCEIRARGRLYGQRS